jgi:hypothetical protein
MKAKKQNSSVKKGPPYPYTASSCEFILELEYNYGKDKMVEGTKFKIKNKRGTYSFVQHVKNVTLDKEWIDCLDDDTKQWKSFTIDSISRIVKPRKPKKWRTKVE